MRATLIEHLNELRVRLFRVVLLLAAGMVAGWFFYLPVFNVLEDIVRANIPPDVEYDPIFINLTAPFMLRLKMAFYIGLFFTLPFTVLQLWGFVSPGLRGHEKKPIKVVAPVSIVLFFIGAGMCWFVLPATITWFVTFVQAFPDTKLMPEAGMMVFLMIKMMLSFGIGFQMPIVVYFLAKFEIVTPKAMLKYWRQAIVVIFLAGAIITPSADPFTLFALSLPLVGLFFGSVWFAQWTIKKNRSDDDELDNLD